MADVAQLGFSADTSALKDAKSSLEALVPAAEKVDKANDNAAASFAKLDASADKLAAAAAGLITASDRLNKVLMAQGDAANVAAAGTTKAVASINFAAAATVKYQSAASNLTVSYGKIASAATGMATNINATEAATTRAVVGLVDYNQHLLDYDAHVDRAAMETRGLSGDFIMATGSLNSLDAALVRANSAVYGLGDGTGAAVSQLNNMNTAVTKAVMGTQDYNAHVLAFRNRTQEAGTAMKFAAHESLNFTRQLSDIGVTLAMGMNPFMIAIQQGPQLLDILQQKAGQTGTSIGTVFRAAGVAIWGAIAPLLPLIIGIGVAVGTVAAVWGLATRSINEGNDDIIKGLGLTKEQLEKVKASGVDTAVTMGDSFKAFFSVIGNRLYEAFEPQFKAVSSGWKSLLDSTASGLKFIVEAMVGYFTGGYRAVLATWSMLPGALGDIGIQAVNFVIKDVEWMINKSIGGLNTLIGYANTAASSLGFDVKLGVVAPVKFDQLNNGFKGQASKTGQAAGAAFAAGVVDGVKSVDKFLDDVTKNAIARRQKAILDAAGDPTKGSATKDKTNKPKEEKYDPDLDPVVQALKLQNELFELGKKGALELADAEKINGPMFKGMVDQINAQMDAYLAKMKAAVDATKDVAKSFTHDFVNGVRQGQSVFEAFGNAVTNVLNKIIDKMLDSALDGLFSGSSGGGLIGTIGSLLNGGSSVTATDYSGLSMGASGILNNTPIAMNAKGNAFSNGIVTAPTLFSFANGTALGQMGEAGPEAIMPLSRGPDGSLGVQMVGGGNSASASPQRVELVVRAEEGEMFRPTVEAIAQDKSVEVTQAGISAYDDQLPTRVQGIASDERAR